MNHYATELEQPPENKSFMKIIDPANEEFNTSPFTAREVVRKLRKCENTASGPDSIPYNHLKKIDPKAMVLTLVVQSLFKIQSCPGGLEEDPDHLYL